MSQPIFGLNTHAINAQAMTADRTSDVIDISEHPGFCLHAIWSGTPAGTIAILASNDGSNFVSVASQAAGGAAGQWLANVEKAHYRYLKITYTFSSSTGTLNAYVSAKDI